MLRVASSYEAIESVFYGTQTLRYFIITSALVFPPQDPEHGLPDGLGLDTVDDGVEHRGHQQVHIGNKGMYNGGQVPLKTVDHGHGDTWNKEDDDGQDMGDTSVEGLDALPGRGQPQDRVQDESVGQDNEQGIYAPSKQYHAEPIAYIDGYLIAGSSHHIRLEKE